MHHRTDTRTFDRRLTRRHVSPAAAVGSVALIAAVLLTTSACGSGSSPATSAGTSRADGGHAAPAAVSAPALDPCTIIPTSGLARVIDARLSQRGPAEERALGRARPEHGAQRP